MPILPILCVREKPDREIKDLVIGNGVSAFKLSLNWRHKTSVVSETMYNIGKFA